MVIFGYEMRFPPRETPGIPRWKIAFLAQKSLMTSRGLFLRWVLGIMITIFKKVFVWLAASINALVSVGFLYDVFSRIFRWSSFGSFSALVGLWCACVLAFSVWAFIKPAWWKGIVLVAILFSEVIFVGNAISNAIK